VIVVMEIISGINADAGRSRKVTRLNRANVQSI
jgi:hypothetical protein